METQDFEKRLLALENGDNSSGTTLFRAVDKSGLIWGLGIGRISSIKAFYYGPTIESVLKQAEDANKVSYRKFIEEQDIPVNIWDDYTDEDGSTYAYIEKYDDITDEQKCLMMKVVYDFIMTLDMSGVEVSYDDQEIGFENLSHEKREWLVEQLEKSNLKYKDIPFNFYSES